MDLYKNFKGMNDEELTDWVSSHAQLGSAASNLAIAELTRRSIIRNEKAVERLELSIKEFSISSFRHSREIVFLTWILIAATFILAIPILNDLIKYIFQR